VVGNKNGEPIDFDSTLFEKWGGDDTGKHEKIIMIFAA